MSIPTPCMRPARRLRAKIGGTIGDTLAALYDTAGTDAPFSPDPESAGLRALRNAALDLLVATEAPDEIDARRAPLPRGVEHDRRHHGAVDPVSAAIAGPR